MDECRFKQTKVEPNLEDENQGFQPNFLVTGGLTDN